jgi:hypothetical protein
MGCHTQLVHGFKRTVSVPTWVVAVPTNLLTCTHTARTCTHMLETTIKLRVSAAELARWKEKAAKDEIPVSEFIRDCVNSICDIGDLPLMSAAGGELRKPGATESGLPERVTPPPPSKDFDRTPIKKCAHGVAKGYHCWQCQGSAVIG